MTLTILPSPSLIDGNIHLQALLSLLNNREMELVRLWNALMEEFPEDGISSSDNTQIIKCAMRNLEHPGMVQSWAARPESSRGRVSGRSHLRPRASKTLGMPPCRGRGRSDHFRHR